MKKQKTLQKAVLFEGLGVHSGKSSSLIISPAPINSGFIFINALYPDDNISIGSIVPEIAMHATVLCAKLWMISTVEHLMAALFFSDLDNVFITVTGDEIPIYDGSALPFVHGLDAGGLEEQASIRHYVTPKEKLEFTDGQGKELIISPAKSGDYSLYIDYTAEFEFASEKTSKFCGIISRECFKESIAPARTFGFLEQLPFLRQHGLAQGSTLGNTVVVGRDGFINDLRFPDECVRHKVLDLVGDVALLGKRLAGSVCAKKTGHSFNRRVTEHYIKNPDLWRVI